MAKDKKLRICSFCGLPESSERRIIEGDNAYICDFCVDVCHQMFDLSRRYEEEAASIPRRFSFDDTLERSMRKLRICDRSERAKKILSVAVSEIISASKQFI